MNNHASKEVNYMKETMTIPVRQLGTYAAIAIIMGGGGFVAGLKYQQGKQTNQFVNGQFRRGMMGARPDGTNGNTIMVRGGFRPVTGEIIAADATSVTVKSPDGSSRIVLFSEKTEITQTATASTAALQTGTTVAVVGQENSDGSISADSIQLNPTLMRLPGRGTTPTP